MSATAAGQWASAQAEVAAVCKLLVSPSVAALDRSSVLLQSAASRLAACRAEAAGSTQPEQLRKEAGQLRQATYRAARLLEGAASFHANWLRLAGALSRGYTGSGEPAAPEPRSRMVVRG